MTATGTAGAIVPLDGDARAAALLAAHHLPTADLGPGTTVRLAGWVEGGRVLGVVGLETFGPVALLRSLAVAGAARGRGLGAALVAHAEQAAVALGAADAYLLTETAEGFFARRGYRRVDRAAAPPAIARTSQFAGLCPASAVFMAKVLR